LEKETDIQAGLISAYTLDLRGKGRSLGWEEINAWDPGQGLLWVHLDVNHELAQNWLMQKSGIDETVCYALMEDGTRPRQVNYEQGMLLILRGVNFNPGADPEDMVALRMWAENDRIITMRLRKVIAVDEIKEAIAMGNGPVSRNDFLTTVIEGLTERIKSVIDEIDDQIDELDEDVLTADIQELRSKLSDLRHQSIRLRRYISPQRDVLIRLYRDRALKLDDEEYSRLRETAERTARFIEDIDHARDRAVIIGEELNSRLAEQMTQTMFRLSAIAAIFMPLGLLTGLLGINVGGIPGATNKSAFFVVCLLLVGIATGLYALFKRIKWL